MAATLTRRLRLHRRGLAAAAAFVAVLAGLQAVAPPPPATTTVVVATADLPGGTRLTARDLTLAAFPAAAAPSGARDRVEDLLGEVLAGPVGQDEPVTERRLLTAAVRPGSGEVAAPVRLADPGVVRLLRPGASVVVVATQSRTGRARVVAESARVLSVPRVAARDRGGLVVLGVTRTEALALAEVPVRGLLTVLLPG